jgi:predicted amidohydrolase
VLGLLGGLFLGWKWLMLPAKLEAPVDLHLATQPEAQSGPVLLAVQPWLNQRHYQSPATLGQHLHQYLQVARNNGALPAGSIVVFPEHSGTWLVAARAPAAAFSAASTQSAMLWLIASHPLGFVRALLGSDEEDRFAAAVFRMQAPAMARDYSQVFGDLAREYGVTIVAGSIVLPDPEVRDGRVWPGTGPLYNVSAVFHPDGRADPQLVQKVHPIPDEAGFTRAASASRLPVFETSAGPLAVLICADSWHPDTYAALAGQGVQTLAVPAFLQPGDVWQSPWHGYTTGWPEDAATSDENQITEHQAWMRYALAGRMQSLSAQSGATAFLRGNLWDLGSDGANILVTPERAWVDGQIESAALSVLPLTGRSN